jgi:outer membrane protein TolC
LIVAFAVNLGACTSFDGSRHIEAANRTLTEFTAGDLRLNRGSPDDRERLATREALLAEPLTQEAAVRVALLGSPSLQALLAQESAQIAEARREGRIDNPKLSYERLRADGETEIARILSLGLLELLTLPQRQRVAAAQGEAAELRLAVTVVDEVTRVRQSWVRAVGATQKLRYAERVLESAAASAELARRMEAAGNFNRINRARQQAFEADARTEAVLARQQAAADREALVRALGLDDAQASRLRLPERLPDVPKTALAPEVASARASSERLDLRLAEAAWRAAARRRGLGEITTRTDIELGVVRDGEAKGYEVELRLPVLDFGDLDRGALDARARATLEELEATRRAVGSHVRESYAGYLAAHALARNHLDELVPLRRAISEESLLRYNGMIIGVFELLADAREQVATVISAIEAEQQYWLADAALKAALVGRPTTTSLAAPARAAASSAKDH